MKGNHQLGNRIALNSGGTKHSLLVRGYDLPINM
jgi:hypothetical protein